MYRNTHWNTGFPDWLIPLICHTANLLTLGIATTSHQIPARSQKGCNKGQCIHQYYATSTLVMHILNSSQLNTGNTYSLAISDDLIIYTAHKYPRTIQKSLEVMLGKINSCYEILGLTLLNVRL